MNPYIISYEPRTFWMQNCRYIINFRVCKTLIDMTFFSFQPKFLGILIGLIGVSFVPPSDNPTIRKGKDFALFFAVDSYDHWEDLRNPVRDAETIARELRDHYEFTTEVLHNPSLLRIYDKLSEYSRKTYAEDAQLMIYFSGHGHYLEQGAEGFFIPKDGLRTVDDPYGRTFIPQARLRDIIARIPCKHILVAIDACYSGAFSRQIAIGRAEDPVLQHVSRNMAYKSRLFLTSGGKERTSDGTDHSPFARAILSALRMDENDLVTYSELVSALEYVRPKPRSGMFEGHEPGGNFYFIGENASIPREEMDRRPLPSREHTTRSEDATYVYDPSGNGYKKINLVGITWTASNLNYTVTDSYCFDNEPVNCERYGRLYTWKAAKETCKALGPGWRLPTEMEWRTLAKKFGGYMYMVDGSWKHSGDPQRAYRNLVKGGSSAFNALLGGWRHTDSGYSNLGSYGFYWSGTEYDAGGAWSYSFNYGKLIRGYNHESNRHSVRCVKGAPSNGID